MINFRYHVVSLTAVFLALAIGLVVGTAAGNGPAADNLKSSLDTSHKVNEQLRDQLDSRQEELDKQEQAWGDAAALTLPGQLSGRRVLVVSVESANKYVDGVQQLLGAANAKVTGRLEVKDKFLDPASNDQLLDIALEAAPPGVAGALPSHSKGVETSTALLAAVLVGTAQVDGARTVLGAYASQGFVSVTGEPSPAEVVVLLTSQPYTGDDAAKRNAAMLTMVDRFDEAGRIVLAANGTSGDGNVVKAVRNDPELAKTVSTVDNVTTALGRYATVCALVEQLAGRTGHYGVGSGATSSMPRPEGNRNGT